MTKRNFQAAEYRAEAAGNFPATAGYYWWRKYPSWDWEVVRVLRCEVTGALIMNGWYLPLQGGEWSDRISEPRTTPNGGQR